MPFEGFLNIPDFNGLINNIAIIPNGSSLPTVPNLVEMAQKSLGYLERNPDPEHDYQNRFSFFLLRCPPFTPSSLVISEEVRASYAQSGHIDPIAVGDTESRNDVAFNQMRAMTGSEDGREVQEIIHQRLVGYLRSGMGDGDGLCWIEPYCFSGDQGLWASPWPTAKLLQSVTDRYKLTGDEGERALARSIFEGLRKVAKWDTGRAFYPAGIKPFRGNETAQGFGGHYPHVLTPVTDYWRYCGDGEALEFAQAMAEGFLSDLQPRHLHRDDGGIDGHNHLQMHAVRGVAQLGALTGDWRYLEWAQRAYAYHHANAFDTGWLPETIQRCDAPDHYNHSETCLSADMMEIEVWLARGGKPRYWDRVERAIRNYFVPAHFSVSQQIRTLWHALNPSASPDLVDVSLKQLQDLEGGFLSALTPNDRVFEVRPGGEHAGMVDYQGHMLVSDMMGCCPPEGMRAIYLAWSNTVVRTEDGIFVNLALEHEDETATVTTEMPCAGHLCVIPKIDGDVWLRPPGWAPRDSVNVWRNGTPIDAHWGGPAHDYIGFADALPGDCLEIRWPLVRFTQSVTERSLLSTHPDVWTYGQTYIYDWVGNSVVGVEPKGTWLPLYE